MSKIFWNLLKVSPIVVSTFLSANNAYAGETNNQLTSVPELFEDNNNIGQVTSVSQFSDVQPTDWAFQALQSLVERYGCIAGYPNGTYRGNRALTRYEFAAGLNACLDRVNELIATATSDLANKEDLATLGRLQEEFSAELATLRGRVDAVEARTAELEANQFSTTTKLQGEAIFNIAQAFGNERAGGGNLDSNTVFSNRLRLRLVSSFTGKDRLEVRLQGRNTQPNSSITGTNLTRLGFDGDEGNSVGVDKINYAFNLTDKVRIKIDANNAELWDNTEVFNPEWRSDGLGAISRYGRFSPIYRQSTGGSAFTVVANPQSSLSLTAAYVAPRNSNPNSGFGLFDGDNTIFGQIAFKPSKSFNIGFAYARTYDSAVDTDNNPATSNPNAVNLFGSTGSTNANRPFGGNVATASNNYGLQATFQPSSKLTLAGWVGYSTAEALNGSNQDASIWYWGTTLGLRDFGKQGNVLGLIFGQPPRVTDVNGQDPDTSYHLEGLYKMKVSDNIQITPGVLVIFNPEHNDNNDPIYIGTVRTTFSF
jgi:hypothetical protein